MKKNQKPQRGQPPLRAIAIAVSLQMMMSQTDALAAGGSGGVGGYSFIIPGGLGGVNGQAGQDGAILPYEEGAGGGGGDRGAAGGAGGNPLHSPLPSGWVRPTGGAAGTMPGQNGGNGADGYLGDDVAFGDGGGGGGGGADGRTATTDTTVASGMLRGGNGGNGGFGGGYSDVSLTRYSGAGGGGGAGGYGLLHSGGGRIVVQSGATVSGGFGGSGGAGGAYRWTPGMGGAGNGGDGGHGIVTTEAATVEIAASATVMGGTGGGGGTGGPADPGDYAGKGGNAGNGGTALALASGSTVINRGTIRGGAGGVGGLPGAGGMVPAQPGQNGIAGAGIRGENLTVINSGYIYGGTGVNGDAPAIVFTGGRNRLELQADPAQITDDVLAGGNDDTLAFADNADRTLSMSAIAGQFFAFEHFEKSGTGTLTLNNAVGIGTAWQIRQGTLAVSADNNLGNASGTLELNGGTLRATATMSTARATTLGADNGTISVDNGVTLTHSGVVSGPGALTKEGSGRLVLGGANTYAAGTVLNAGFLDASGTAMGSGPITVNNGYLSLSQGFDGQARRIRNNGGYILMYDTSSLGQAQVENAGGITYLNQSTTAASATIVNTGGIMSFQDGATAANSHITTEAGSLTEFVGWSSPGNATLIANGTGRVDFSQTAGPAFNRALTAGAIAGSGRFQLGQNQLAVGGNNASTTVSGVIEDGGAGGGTGGRLSKVGTGTLVLNGINTYTGATEVNGGTLIVGDATHAQARVAGDVNVNAGGTLGGYGTVGNTVVRSGATLSTGNSIGTLNVSGDLRFDAGSAFRVEADPASSASDRVVVSGTATLGGGVLHVGPDGNFSPTRTYTILTASTLQGRFASVSSNYAFLDPRLGYGAQDVTLELVRKEVPVDPGTPGTPGTPGNPGTPEPPVTRPIRFADAANTGNQRAVANGLDSLAAGNALHQAVLTLPQGAPPAVFDSLSGEAYASATTALIGLAGTATRLPLGHLRNNLSAGKLPGALIAQVGGPLPAAALPVSAAQPVWVEVLGSWQTLRGDGNAAGARQQTGGFFAGADAEVGGGWRAGGAFGYANSTIRVTDRSSRTIADTFSGSLYGGKAFAIGPGKARVMAGAAYSWHDIDTDREAAVAGSTQSLKAGYSASTAQVFSEAGYALPLSAKVDIEPYAGVAWAQMRTRGFAESGGNAALRSPGDRNDLTTTTLGLRSRLSFALGDSEGVLQAGAGWRHAFGDARPTSTLAFEGGQAFTVAGVPIARDAAVAELQLDLPLSRTATLGLRYTGQFGGGNRDNTGTVAMRWRFR